MKKNMVRGAMALVLGFLLVVGLNGCTYDQYTDIFGNRETHATDH